MSSPTRTADAARFSGSTAVIVLQPGLTVRDRITLVWCDLPWQWTVAREKAEAVTYAADLRDYLSLLLPYEEVMYIVLAQVFLPIEHK